MAASDFPVEGDWEAGTSWVAAQMAIFPREILAVLTSRTAVRFLPKFTEYIYRRDGFDAISGSEQPHAVLLAFRAHAISSVTTLAPTDDQNFSDIVFDTTEVVNRVAHHTGALSATKAISTYASGYFDAAKVAAFLTVNFYDPNAAAAAITADVQALHAGLALEELAARPLWPGDRPEELQQDWQKFRAELITQGDHWDLWAQWYDGVLAGEKNRRYLFGLHTTRAFRLIYDLVTLPETLWNGPPGTQQSRIHPLGG